MVYPLVSIISMIFGIMASEGLEISKTPKFMENIGFTNGFHQFAKANVFNDKSVERAPE